MTLRRDEYGLNVIERELLRWSSDPSQIERPDRFERWVRYQAILAKMRVPNCNAAHGAKRNLEIRGLLDYAPSWIRITPEGLYALNKVGTDHENVPGPFKTVFRGHVSDLNIWPTRLDGLLGDLRRYAFGLLGEIGEESIVNTEIENCISRIRTMTRNEG